MAVVIAIGMAAASDPVSAAGKAASATGTWSGEIVLGGVSQTLTVQLHRQDDDRILGYVVGGTAGRSITGGVQSGADLSFDLEFADPVLSRTIAVSATVGAKTLDGQADDGGVVVPIHWERVNPNLFERAFVFAELGGGGDPGPLIELAVVQGKGGKTFIGGAFVSRTECDLFACAGAVTDFVEGSDGLGNETIDAMLATGGGCPGTGSFSATFDATTRLYTGTFQFTDCIGLKAGNVIGARTTRASSKDAAKVLESFARLTAALESDVEIGPSDVPLSMDYLHLGATRADRLAEFNQDIGTYDGMDDISVHFSRFRKLHTIDEPDALPEVVNGLFGVDFRDLRIGVVGGVPEVFRDVDTTDGADELKFLAKKGTDWLIHGNQVTHDLPLAGYSIGPAHIVAPTAGGDIFVSIGPWGAHVGPHTGHIEGNAKADWFGLYATALDQLIEPIDDFAGNEDGVCDVGEPCGIEEADLVARMIDYVVPAGPFEVTDVRLERLEPAGLYYGTDEHWRVRGRVAYYTYDFVHLREISADLRDAMVAAGYADPWLEDAPTDNLITGAPVALKAGDTIARPQTVAQQILDTGIFTGNFGIPEAPWQQMEFFTGNTDTGRDESFYSWLTATLEDELAGVLEDEALDPLSFRYHQAFLVERRWKAEMALSNAEFMDRDDYSTLFSALGGWWENPGVACDGTQAACDELFSIYPIGKDTVFYHAALYDDADVSYLAIRSYHDEVPPTLYGEVLSPADLDPEAGTLVVKWRDFGDVVQGYQGLGYRLDTAGRTLRVAWGAIVASEAAALAALPAVPADTDLCDGATLTCHSHDKPES